jgi:negative regulator of flagellin synthesis FlgM
MKIGSYDNSKLGGLAGSGPVAAAPGKPAAPATPPEASAKVALSSAAASLVNESNADFDAAKVARITQAIREGKFKINAEAIADQLISNAKDLLGGPQH